MDLTTLDVKSAAQKGADLVLKHPATGERLDAVLRVIGRDSPSVAAAMLDIERRKASGEVFDKEAEGIELLLAVIKGWRGVEFDGEALEYTPDNARKLLTDPRTSWIGEQVAPFSLSRRNFVKNYSRD